jgi:hypothetical protein
MGFALGHFSKRLKVPSEKKKVDVSGGISFGMTLAGVYDDSTLTIS